NTADRATMVLPFYEPRAYPASEIVSVVYEGQLDRTHDTGYFSDSSEGPQHVALANPSVSFCPTGVQDRRLTAEMGAERFGLTEGALERFVSRHTDYVQVSSWLYDERDAYWSSTGATCGEGTRGVTSPGYELCDSLFGQGDEEELSSARDLTIVSAQNGELELTPRDLRGFSPEELLSTLRCC